MGQILTLTHPSIYSPKPQLPQVTLEFLGEPNPSPPTPPRPPPPPPTMHLLNSNGLPLWYNFDGYNRLMGP